MIDADDFDKWTSRIVNIGTVLTENARAEAPAFRHGEEAHAPLMLKQLNM